MSLSVAVDAVVLIAAVLGTWWGWGRGAARMIISTLATVAGLFLAAQGRAPVSAAVSALLPDVDARFVSLLVLVGAAWILLGIAAWLLGNALRTLLQAHCSDWRKRSFSAARSSSLLRQLEPFSSQRQSRSDHSSSRALRRSRPASCMGSCIRSSGR
jgi:hypothetical protein